MHRQNTVRADSVWIEYIGAAPAPRISAVVHVQNEAPGTYYCVLRWDAGYTGFQLDGDLWTRQAIFSVWDQPAGEARIEQNLEPAKVGMERFGGEGEGCRSRRLYDWDTSHFYQFDVTARSASSRTYYSARLRDFPNGNWLSLGTISIPGTRPFMIISSFLENFTAPPTQTPEDIPYRSCKLTEIVKWASVEDREMDAERDRIIESAKRRQTSWPESQCPQVAQQVEALAGAGWFWIASGGNVQPTHGPDVVLTISPGRADFTL